MAKKKRKVHLPAQKKSTSQFCQAVSASDLQCNGCCKSGMQAVEKKDKKFIAIEGVTGSINLDKAKEKVDARSNRWDYGFGYNKSSEEALWIEVHNASTSEIGTMLNKLKWLEEWLQQPEQELLRELTKKRQSQGKSPYIWVSTGAGVHLSANSPQARRLSSSKIDGPRRGTNLP